MQNEIPLTLTTLRNDAEQMAYFRAMNDLLLGRIVKGQVPTARTTFHSDREK